MGRDMQWSTIDLLLGILRDGSSQAARLLNDNGVTVGLTDSLLSEGLDDFCDPVKNCERLA